jgi:hypothetical protein
MMLKRLSSLFIVAISLFALWHSDMRTTVIDALGRIVRTVEAWEMERLIEKARAAEVEHDSIDEERELLVETLPELGETEFAKNFKQRIADLEDRALLPAISRGEAILELDALAQLHRDTLAIRTGGLGYPAEGTVVLISNETTAEESSAAESSPADPSPADSTPADSTPADSRRAESTPADSSPTDPTPTDSSPADSSPADPIRAESSLAGSSGVVSAESDDKDATVEMPVSEESAAVVTNGERQHSARPNYESPTAAATAAPCRTVIVKQIVPARASQKSYGCR